MPTMCTAMTYADDVGLVVVLHVRRRHRHHRDHRRLRRSTIAARPSSAMATAAMTTARQPHRLASAAALGVRVDAAVDRQRIGA